ncbi:MAG TPA: PAS domain S-box protein [Candidatus Magasanikbacteria bacterium]|nr:PAS domain S-box protein [Candidatus Magasanikbacteria bacterium]
MLLKGSDVYQVRCKKCNKLLAINGSDNGVEIKCGRCGCLNIVFEEMSEQVIITDPEGTILFVNGALNNITGYTIDEAIGKTPSLWGGQMSKEFYEEMWHAIKHEKRSVQVIVKNKTKSGKLYNAKLQISPVLDTQGNTRFFVGIETVIKDG